MAASGVQIKYLGDEELQTGTVRTVSPTPSGLPPPPSPVLPPSEMRVAVAASSASKGAAPQKWEKTLKRAIPSIVALRFIAVRNFDTESATCSQGTGFIVDAKQGIILTNRHLVNPVRRQCVDVQKPKLLRAPSWRKLFCTTMKNFQSSPYTATPSMILASSSLMFPKCGS